MMDINAAALILAIIYPIEVTSSQALRAIIHDAPLPQEQEITDKLIGKCRKLITRNATWEITELAYRSKVNVYELYKRSYG